MKHTRQNYLTALLLSARRAARRASQAFKKLPKLLTPGVRPDHLERWRDEGRSGDAAHHFDEAMRTFKYRKMVPLVLPVPRRRRQTSSEGSR
ncbi:hypothetical protein [Deinococcus yavapaiensis]|uniref:Uncharacterized protein n=1 Tax=Deinococcus yavapaiensis KR-236 TaxID=694435 RepID=A0A318S6X8_9DEIO|nr:hypothetical protein [Deinococcus yavapaiensis]PYE50491.1 hypothetical protein DES52_1179 [Deinococcus yavapaiensis KR-236]